MKKFILCTLSFVALSLIMASCGDGNAPDMPKDFPTTDNLKNFSVDFQTLQADYAEVKVTSADKDCFFYWAYMKSSAYDNYDSREEIQAHLTQLYEDAEFPYDLDQGEGTGSLELNPGTKYLFMVFKVVDGYVISGEIEYKIFESPAE